MRLAPAALIALQTQPICSSASLVRPLKILPFAQRVPLPETCVRRNSDSLELTIRHKPDVLRQPTTCLGYKLRFIQVVRPLQPVAANVLITVEDDQRPSQEE